MGAARAEAPAKPPAEPPAATFDLQEKLDAIAQGGEARLPCGAFRLAETVSVVIAPGAHLALRGGGAGCTRLFAGTKDALRFFYGGPDSSLTLENLTLVTEGSGATAIALTLKAAEANPAVGAVSVLRDVALVGADFTGARTNFWARGVVVSGVSNVDYDALAYMGRSGVGEAIVIRGVAERKTYSVSHRIRGARIVNCGTGVFFGDWTQGVWVVDSDVVGCAQGIVTEPKPAGELDQLFVRGNEFGYGLKDVVVAGPISDVVITNNQFGDERGRGYAGVTLAGARQYVVAGNVFFSTNGAGATAIRLAGAAPRGPNLVSGNAIFGFAAGIEVGPVAARAKIAGNEFGRNAVDYGVAPGASGLLIVDDAPRPLAALPACGAGLDGSRFVVRDAKAPKYLEPLEDGGERRVEALCDGPAAGWRAH